MTLTKRKTLIAAVVAFLLATGGVWFAVTQTTAETPATAPPVQSKCDLPGTAGNPTTSIPTRWENSAGWFLPISDTDGPGIRNPVASWSCFAHTPTGAVLAGYVIPMRVEGIAEDWKTVVREQTVPGAAQALKLRSTPPQSSEQVTLRGFSVAAYSDTRATIAYYLHTPTLDLSCTADLQWLDGDWRLQLQENGDTLSGCIQGVPSSFVPWGPS